MKNKDLNEIRPAKGGVKRSNPPPPPSAAPIQPHVVRDVAPASSDLPLPTEDAAKIAFEAQRLRERLMLDMRRVNQLMAKRVLPENRSVKDSEEEKEVVASLVGSAKAVEDISPGEGLLAIAVLAVRQGLSLRDAGNRLAYEVGQLRRDVEALKGSGESDGRP